MLVATLPLLLAFAPGHPSTPTVAPLDPAPAVAAPLVGPSPAAPASEAAVEPKPAIEPPRFRGIGMFVSGGLLGSLGLPLKLIATRSDMRQAAEFDREGGYPDYCIESCYVGGLLNVSSMPLIVISAGLIGGGMTMQGRRAAHRDVALGLPHRTLRTRLMIGLGFAAIGAGLGAVVASRFAMSNAESEGQWVARRELGWWAAVAGLYAGSGLAGYGVGYRAGRRKLDRRLQARVAPMLSPQVVGLGMTGRF